MPRGRRTVRSRRVAGELRRLRARSGHSCSTVGAALGISASKISRIETGRIGLVADEVAALLSFYQVAKPLREELLELVRRAAEPGWWQVQGSRLPELWQELIDIERSATAIINYELLLIPGLLQTADYAGALIAAANPALSDDEVETRVAARTARQALLGRAHSRSCTASPPAISTADCSTPAIGSGSASTLYGPRPWPVPPEIQQAS